MRRAALLAAAVGAVLGACGRGPVEYRMQWEAMGTTVTVRAVAAEEATARAAGEAAGEAIARVERLASTYDPDSELSRLNATAEGGAVSEELYEILSLAYAAAEATEGYFDPTVGPLVAAYGIKEGTPRWPDDDEKTGSTPASPASLDLTTTTLRGQLCRRRGSSTLPWAWARPSWTVGSPGPTPLPTRPPRHL